MLNSWINQAGQNPPFLFLENFKKVLDFSFVSVYTDSIKTTEAIQND